MLFSSGSLRGMKDMTTQSSPVARAFTLASPLSMNTRQRAAGALLRTAAAAPLFFHGSQKLCGWFGGGGIAEFAAYLAALGVPFPMLSAGLAAVSEVSGAAVLALGLGGWALAPVLFTMLVATLTSLRNGFDVMHGGAEFPLTLVLVLAAVALLTPAARRTP
jgi:putative oxidoreductase